MAPADCSYSTRNLKDTQLEFILTELSTGLTFASVAENEAKGQAKSRAHARAAYDSVRRFLPIMTLTQQEFQKVQNKLEALEKRLKALGEMF